MARTRNGMSSTETQDIFAKMEHHRKMQLFFKQYLRAMQVVDTFDIKESALSFNGAKFCQVRTCTELENEHRDDYDAHSGLCMKHEFAAQRRIEQDRRGFE